jgi:hypothetical protein
MIGEIKYEITNSTGAILITEKTELKSSNYQSLDFNLSDQANGIYYIRIVHNNKVIVKKFILNN